MYALKKLNVHFETLPFHNFVEIVSPKMCYHVAHSLALIKEKEFTHVMFIGGLNIPDYILESYYHVKNVVVGTEDPHSFDPMKYKIDKIDYYFSNEKSIGNSSRYKNVFYCPTAASEEECGKIPREQLDPKYHSDILFIGAAYPNRRKMMEALIPIVEKHNLKFNISGHVNYMPRRSPLWDYVGQNGTVDHEDTIKYYNGAKIVLNFFRDIKWNPRTRSGGNPNNKSRYPALSLNPRAYEVPLCQSFMLMEDSREEAREVFTDKEVGFFSNTEELCSQVEKYIKNEKLREQMAFNAYKKVALNHTYTHRLQKILNVLKES
jgi:spore maturation protein CgeB